jgi:hypothetical protein
MRSGAILYDGVNSSETSRGPTLRRANSICMEMFPNS